MRKMDKANFDKNKIIYKEFKNLILMKHRQNRIKNFFFFVRTKTNANKKNKIYQK